VRAWSIAGANMGLRADRFPGVDIDSTDAALTEIVKSTAFARLGETATRTGRAPKALLIYRTDEPFGRMRLWMRRGDEQHLVEVLGQGQQYVVYGMHPTTMQPYVWDAPMEQVKAADLNAVTREQCNDFLNELEGICDLLGYVTEREGDGKPITHVAAEQGSLKAPSLELLRDAVRLIPNTNELFPDRTSYLTMGYAIRAAGADDLDEAFSIYYEWAMKWEGNARVAANDPETVLSDWRRMKGASSVGWSLIAEHARNFGFDAASLEFEAVEAKPEEQDKTAPKHSDQWLADQVVKRQRGNLRYSLHMGCFLAWAGGVRWQPDAELLAEDIVKQELRLIAIDVLRRGASPKEKKDAQVLANAICTSGKVPAIAALIKSDRSVAVNIQSLDHDPWQLNTPSGIVDLKSGAITPPDPDALCTKITTVPPDFNGQCPRWLEFLTEATAGDADLVAYLRRLSGYALTGSTREQQFTFIFGAGGNGKGTFLNVLTGILGEYAQTASMDTFTASTSERHSTDIAMLAGARLVTASETESGKRWNESRLKSLTGGDLVTARFMRQNNFTFRPQFKLIFIGNHKPEVRNVDAAMKRRAHMVPFTVAPARIDQDLSEKLREEWPAILAWMIAGCVQWQLEGLNPPAIVRNTTEEYFQDEDAVGRWLKECTEVCEEGGEGSQTLFASWREWANREGEYVGSLKRLSAALVSRNIPRWRDKTFRRHGFGGIRLLSANTPSLDDIF
jgi:putative DNA primase/helicase